MANSNGDQPNTPALGLEAFLNPNSMITPGAAGALTMGISTAIVAGFDLPVAWTGLGISFLLGTIVFVGTAGASIPIRFLYYVINSLIIFSIAAGTGQALYQAMSSEETTAIRSEYRAASLETPALASVDSGGRVAAEYGVRTRPRAVTLAQFRPWFPSPPTSPPEPDEERPRPFPPPWIGG